MVSVNDGAVDLEHRTQLDQSIRIQRLTKTLNDHQRSIAVDRQPGAAFGHTVEQPVGIRFLRGQEVDQLAPSIECRCDQLGVH